MSVRNTVGNVNVWRSSFPYSILQCVCVYVCRTAGAAAAASSATSDDEESKKGKDDEPKKTKGKGGDDSSSSSSSESKSSGSNKGMSKPRKGKAAHKQGKQQFGEETEDVPDTNDHSFPWRSLDFVQLDALWSDKREIAKIFNVHFIQIADDVPLVKETDYGQHFENHPSIKAIHEKNSATKRITKNRATEFFGQRSVTQSMGGGLGSFAGTKSDLVFF